MTKQNCQRLMAVTVADKHWSHMSTRAKIYRRDSPISALNLPLPLAEDGVWNLCSPVLLLGRAGTGKTTTVQTANRCMEQQGLKDRIVLAAYTGVAASNMGSGAHTIVSLFRLRTSW